MQSKASVGERERDSPEAFTLPKPAAFYLFVLWKKFALLLLASIVAVHKTYHGATRKWAEWEAEHKDSTQKTNRFEN